MEKKSVRKAMKPKQPQKKIDKPTDKKMSWVSGDERRGVFGSSSAGLVHHPPHQEHDVDQDPLKMTGEKEYS